MNNGKLLISKLLITGKLKAVQRVKITEDFAWLACVEY